MTTSAAQALRPSQGSKGLAVAWLVSNLGLVLFVAGVVQPHIDPVCSSSPWSALAWIFLVLAICGLVLAVIALAVVVRQGRAGAIALWTAALCISLGQVAFAVLMAHMATIPCGLALLS